MTDYVILRKEDGTENGWREYGTERASSPARALRVAEMPAGTYAAVPARSWKPLTVKSETVTKITIG